jgi:hypothetical protein
LRSHHGANLVSLHVGGNNIGSAGAVVLFDALFTGAAPLLQDMDVAFINMGVTGAIALAHSLPQLLHLKCLDLHGNSVGTDGAIALSCALRESPRLRVMNIEHNGIHLDGAIALARSLAYAANLSILFAEAKMATVDGVTLGELFPSLLPMIAERPSWQEGLLEMAIFCSKLNVNLPLRHPSSMRTTMMREINACRFGYMSGRGCDEEGSCRCGKPLACCLLPVADPKYSTTVS